jgi:hypothetical protein
MSCPRNSYRSHPMGGSDSSSKNDIARQGAMNYKELKLDVFVAINQGRHYLEDRFGQARHLYKATIVSLDKLDRFGNPNPKGRFIQVRCAKDPLRVEQVALGKILGLWDEVNRPNEDRIKVLGAKKAEQKAAEAAHKKRAEDLLRQFRSLGLLVRQTGTRHTPTLTMDLDYAMPIIIVVPGCWW